MRAMQVYCEGTGKECRIASQTLSVAAASVASAATEAAAAARGDDDYDDAEGWYDDDEDDGAGGAYRHETGAGGWRDGDDDNGGGSGSGGAGPAQPVGVGGWCQDTFRDYSLDTNSDEFIDVHGGFGYSRGDDDGGRWGSVPGQRAGERNRVVERGHSSVVERDDSEHYHDDWSRSTNISMGSGARGGAHSGRLPQQSRWALFQDDDDGNGGGGVQGDAEDPEEDFCAVGARGIVVSTSADELAVKLRGDSRAQQKRKASRDRDHDHNDDVNHDYRHNRGHHDDYEASASNLSYGGPAVARGANHVSHATTALHRSALATGGAHAADKRARIDRASDANILSTHGAPRGSSSSAATRWLDSGDADAKSHSLSRLVTTTDEAPLHERREFSSEQNRPAAVPPHCE
jgi:hypothetical protein